MDSYHVPTALTVIAGVFLVSGAVCGLAVLVDIILRRGWKSMMLIMIPTYPITATYMGPLGIYLYFRYGRAKSPTKLPKNDEMNHLHHSRHRGPASTGAHGNHVNHPEHLNHMDHTQPADPEKESIPPKHDMSMHDIHMHDMGGPPRPLWVTVLIGISHCGAGCVLGDLVGEWLVFGTGAMIHGHDLWPSLLIDYAFALFFGIFFQYFSIAPMSGNYGLKTLIRAAKADFLSLTAFEIGLFGWMVAYQAGIWNYRLEMTTWVYWWMMQVGMFLGFWTAAPVNWWLITRNIKEPGA